jgi:hypothetical protein
MAAMRDGIREALASAESQGGGGAAAAAAQRELNCSFWSRGLESRYGQKDKIASLLSL